jgi:O-antigen/teichoic acid export membrane protein
MNNIKKSELNILISIAYQIIAITLGLIIPRITMTGYGSDTNGLLSSALQFVGYLAIFEAGVQAVATKSLYKTVGSNDNAGTNAILAAVNINYRKIGMYYLVGLTILSSIYPFVIKEKYLSFSTVFFVVFFSGLSNVVLFFFQGKYRILLQVEGKNYFIGLMNIVTNISNHGIKIILLSLKVNIATVVFGSFIASMIPAVIIMVHIKRKYKWINLKVKPNFSSLAQSKYAVIHQLSWIIFSSTDILLLTIFCDLKVVSVYVIYKMINDYVLTFSKIPFESMSFRLGHLYNNDKERFKKYINCAELFTSNLGFTLFTVTLCLTTSFISLYTKGVNDINYVDAKLAVLFVSVQLLSLMRTPMLNTIGYSGHFKQTLIPTIIETTINIVVSIVGVIFFGIYGVLAGTIVALLYRTVDIILYSNKKLLNRSPMRTFTYYVVEGLLIAGTYIIYNSMNMVVDNFLKFLIVGAALTIGVGGIIILTSCLLFRDELAFLKSNVIKGK